MFQMKLSDRLISIYEIWQWHNSVECCLIFVALISTSTSNTGPATSIQIDHDSVQNAATIPSPRNSVFTSSSDFSYSSSTASEAGMSSDHVMQQTALTRPPLVTSVFNVSYISTQPVLNEMTRTVFVSSAPYTPYLLTHYPVLTTSLSEEKETPVLAVTSRVTDTSQPVNSVTIAPSTTVEVTVMESRTTQGQGHRIKKLLEGIKQ